MNPKSFKWLIRCMVIFVALIGSASSTIGQTIYETENATLFGLVVATQYAGYSGTGYADYQNASGDYVEFSFNASSTGTYPIAFRYANGGTGDRPLQLSVNGTVVASSLSFPVTGGNGPPWAFTATNNVTFNAGINTVAHHTPSAPTEPTWIICWSRQTEPPVRLQVLRMRS